jgi:hypothetical protein
METLVKYKQVIAAACVMAFSVALYFNTGTIRVLQPISASYVNSRFFPYIIAVLLFAAGLAELVASIRRLPRADAPGGAKAGLDRAGVLRIIATLLLLVVYVALLNTLGFWIMTMAYLFCQILLLTPGRKRHVPFAAGLSVAASSLIYWLFSHVLTLMLPRGPLPF